MNVLNKIRLKFSWWWLPYIGIYPFMPFTKVIWFIFAMMVIHELAHIICALSFSMPVKTITVYPFGISAEINEIGYCSFWKEFIILISGPLMHLVYPCIFGLLNANNIISNVFYMDLLQLNLGLLFFNLLPIYPLDGGRIMQNIIHGLFKYRLGLKICYLMSLTVLIVLLVLHILNGFSGMFFAALFGFSNIVAYKQIPLEVHRFYMYRKDISASKKAIINQSFDLYRYRDNIIKHGYCFMSEKDFLKYYLHNVAL